jgi:predicted nucleic acid-binding protein
MRVVLDTNILVSALIAPAGKPAAIYSAWVEGKFTLLTCAAHLDELLATLEKPRIAELIKPYKAGRLVNQIKRRDSGLGIRGSGRYEFTASPVRHEKSARFQRCVAIKAEESAEVARPPAHA